MKSRFLLPSKIRRRRKKSGSEEQNLFWFSPRMLMRIARNCWILDCLVRARVPICMQSWIFIAINRENRWKWSRDLKCRDMECLSNSGAIVSRKTEDSFVTGFFPVSDWISFCASLGSVIAMKRTDAFQTLPLLSRFSFLISPNISASSVQMPATLPAGLDVTWDLLFKPILSNIWNLWHIHFICSY